MQLQFLRSYEWMFARPRGDGIFPQSCHPETYGNGTTFVSCTYGQTPHGTDAQEIHANQDLDTCSFAVKSL